MQIGILGLLGIIFVVAKLAGYIDWSWWLVLLPIYGGLILGFVAFFFGIGIAAIAMSRTTPKRRW